MADLKFLLDMDRTSVLELKLGTYIRGDRGPIGPQGEDGPPGTLTDDDIAFLQSAEDAAAASAAAALQSQGAAAGSASAASASAGSANSSATASGASATQSAQSAAAAAGSATQAAGAQTDVATNANAAAASAQAAHTSETNAATSATGAAGSATAAGNSATAAAGSATAAGTSATNAANSATAAASVQLLPFRNLFHNARFQLNQRYWQGGTAAPTNYAVTLDRWRIVTVGQSITWAADASGTFNTVNCPAGGFQQVIDQADIAGGPYVINWGGTATGWLNGTSPLTKGQVLNINPGSPVQIDFRNGTLYKPQLEPGTIPTAFEMIPRSMEIQRCGFYFRVVTIDMESSQVGGQNAIWNVNFPFMRTVPTPLPLVRGGTPSYANVSSPPTFWCTNDAVTCTVPVVTTGTWFVVGYGLGLSSDL
jgi:hypothetical protein